MKRHKKANESREILCFPGEEEERKKRNGIYFFNKKSRKKDKMPPSGSNKKEEVVKQDTKPPSTNKTTKRENFRKRVRSDDSHKKKGDIAEDGARIAPRRANVYVSKTIPLELLMLFMFEFRFPN